MRVLGHFGVNPHLHPQGDKNPLRISYTHLMTSLPVFHNPSRPSRNHQPTRHSSPSRAPPLTTNFQTHTTHARTTSHPIP
jgi:hypothetical protein